jgi:hypothetical protein
MTRAITDPQRLPSSALAVIAEAPSTGPVMAGSSANSYALRVRNAFDLIAWLVMATAPVSWGFAGMRHCWRQTYYGATPTTSGCDVAHRLGSRRKGGEQVTRFPTTIGCVPSRLEVVRRGSKNLC